jgi:hypothetical protein
MTQPDDQAAKPTGNSRNPNNHISLSPLDFDQALEGLLGVKSPKKRGDDVTNYRGIEIHEDKIGIYKSQGGTQSIKRYRCVVGGHPIRGTWEEVKQRIDEALGPEEKPDEQEG